MLYDSSAVLSSHLFTVQASSEIGVMESNMKELYQSASLFEVNVPDYKQLKTCRKLVTAEINDNYTTIMQIELRILAHVLVLTSTAFL